MLLQRLKGPLEHYLPAMSLQSFQRGFCWAELSQEPLASEPVPRAHGLDILPVTAAGTWAQYWAHGGQQYT